MARYPLLNTRSPSWRGCVKCWLCDLASGKRGDMADSEDLYMLLNVDRYVWKENTIVCSSVLFLFQCD